MLIGLSVVTSRENPADFKRVHEFALVVKKHPAFYHETPAMSRWNLPAPGLDVTDGQQASTETVNTSAGQRASQGVTAVHAAEAVIRKREEYRQ